MFTKNKPADATALERQNRRIHKLKAKGVSRSTIFVHDACKPLLNELKPLLIDPASSEVLAGLVNSLPLRSKPINVAQVQQLSPFRYPGGKTWLVPYIRTWLASHKRSFDVFVEPFAGGAMAGLTAASEKLAYSVVLSEIDPDVSSVWNTIFDGSEDDIIWLTNRILTFEVTAPKVQKALAEESNLSRNMAFKTIVKNRMQRGGIMAQGAGLVKTGEAGRGLRSRWYPETLVKRIEYLRTIRDRISFQEADAFITIAGFADNSKAAFFIDPPYTAGGKKAGSRLYSHSMVDHENLFKVMSKVKGPVIMSYDDSADVRKLADRYGFKIETIAMKSTHHAIMNELLIQKA